MPTAVSRGSYYQLRSRKWLQARGFTVCTMHFSGWMKVGPARFVPFTRDLFGADLLAVSPDVTWFVQVKGGEGWRDHLAAARQKFAGYPVGVGSAQIILGWPPQARAPEVITVS